VVPDLRLTAGSESDPGLAAGDRSACRCCGAHGWWGARV